jgi:hypothetical protein
MSKNKSNKHYAKGKVPSDAPTTLKDPEYAKRKRSEEKLLQAEFDDKCGPVTIRRVGEPRP